MGNVNMEAKQIHDRTEAGKRQSVAEHLAALDAVAKKIDDMPTYTSVDRAFLDEWETNLPILANDVSNLGTTKANQITIAPFFNAETAYDPGDIVYYNGLSYRCVNAHEGEWDADDFAATTIDNELSSLNSNLNTLESGLNELISHSLDTGVAIESGVAYTCPSDGYLRIYVQNNKEMDVFINGSSGLRFDVKNASGTGGHYPLFVKKGMVISATYASDDGSIQYKALI